MSDDARQLRNRLEHADAAMDRDQGGHAYASACEVVKTTTMTSYPTAANKVFACIIQDINADETEGAAVSYVPRAGAAPIFCINLGTGIPEPDTTLLADGAGDRWSFRYDG